MRYKIKELVGIVLVIGLFLLSCTSRILAEETIRNKRAVIFYPEDFQGGSRIKPLSWYKDILSDFGVDVTTANAKEISDVKFLTKKRFDTLILPNGNYIPFEAHYSICVFLSEGGNVVTSDIPYNSIKYDSEKNKWVTHRGHPRGWYAAFQIRRLRGSVFKWAWRSLNHKLKVNPDIPSYLLKRLPSTVGPFNKTFGMSDKWNLYQRGDYNSSGGENIETASNIIFPVYLLKNGEPTDFIAYRYHNHNFNGSTMVILGQLGTSLLGTDSAKEVIYVSLKLCEMRLPGEPELSYYERLIKLQREISAFGELFIETYYPLRDLTLCNFYKKDQDFYELKNKMLSCEKALSDIMSEKQSIDKLLLAESRIEEQDRRRKELLSRIEKEKERFRILKNELAKDMRKINYPGDIKIEHPLGGFVVEAYLTLPNHLYMLRKWHYQNLKKLGIDIFSWPKHGHSNDPEVKEARKGIRKDLGFYYAFKHLLPSSGTLNPSTGKVKETPRKVIDYKKAEKSIGSWLRRKKAAWKDGDIFRVGTAHESGLGRNFWGEQAREEYQEYLKDKYKDIYTLNKRWSTVYKEFKEIKLITKPPKTISEHSNWEDWTNFREEKHVSVVKFMYETFKKYDPEILVSHTISAGSMRYPFYGINYYNLTKYQDLSGIDGTATGPGKEWVYLDLTTKPVFTAEWGAFYVPPASIMDGRKRLSKQLWQEISGGEVGINCWLWSWGGYRGNHVDITGLPTLYGWEVKRLASGFRKFDHILLDGKRTADVRILFSDTSRCHTQGWGSWGEGTFCTHLDATSNFYSSFLTSHTPARVIAEEAILEGVDISECKLLVVPHAEYLSEELQNKLLDYVKNGGNLLLEGESGKFDNYGQPKNLLFQEAGVARSAVANRKIFLDDAEIRLPEKDESTFSFLLFSPEKGKVLLKYVSGEPALVSVSAGKGKILVSGIPFALKNLSASSMIMEKIFKEINVEPRYICSDNRLLIREWEYKGDQYLICAYPTSKSLINEFTLKIKGNCKVIDYMLGTEIPSTFDGKYTSFSGIIPSDDGRVYQLQKTSSGKTSVSPHSQAEAKKNLLKPNPSADNLASLPYKGKIYTREPKEIESFIFQVNIISPQNHQNPDEGEAYLIVSKEKERLKRKIERGKDYLFSFKDICFEVKCISSHFVFPFYVDLEIKKSKRKPIISSCSFQKKNSGLLLSNGLVRLKILPEKGGRIIKYSTLPDGINHVFATGDRGGIKEVPGRKWSIDFFGEPFSHEIINNTQEEIKILLKMNRAVDGLLLEKTLTLKKNESKINLKIEEYNYGKILKSFSLRLHPVLNIGGIADGADCFFIPTPDGLKKMFYNTEGGFYFTSAEGWAGCVDTNEKIAYIASFPSDEVEKVLIWMSPDSYNLELFTPKREIESLKALPLNVNLFLIKGLSGIDNFQKGFASHIFLPEIFFSQDREIGFTVELASPFLKKKKLAGKVFLLKNKKRIKKIGDFSRDVSFEQPLEKDISFGAKALSDGEYEIFLSLSDEKGVEFLNAKKKIFLIGNAKKKHLKVYDSFKKSLKKLKAKYPAKHKELFSTFVLIEKFREAIEKNKKEEISVKKKMIEQMLEEIR